MSLDDKTRDVKISKEYKEQAYSKVDSLKQYFYKGARNMLAAIDMILEDVRKNPANSEFKEDARNCYTEFEKHYPEITKEDVKKTPELAPLYELKPLRKELGPLLTHFLDAPTQENEKKVKTMIKTIIQTAEKFGTYFMDAVREVRKFDPAYQAKITDRKGRVYNY